MSLYGDKRGDAGAGGRSAPQRTPAAGPCACARRHTAHRARTPSQLTPQSFFTMSNLDFRSIGTVLGSTFFLAARCARISAAVILRLRRGGSGVGESLRSMFAAESGELAGDIAFAGCAVAEPAEAGRSGASRSGIGSPGAGATTSNSASSGRCLIRATTCL